jgi:hypothetical protein
MQEDQIRQIVREETERVLREGSSQREFFDAMFKWAKWGVGLLVGAMGFVAALKFGTEYFGDEIKDKVDELRTGGIAALVVRSRSFSSEDVETYETGVSIPSIVIENAAFCALIQTDGACSLARGEPKGARWTLVSRDDATQCQIVCVPDSGAGEMRSHAG